MSRITYDQAVKALLDTLPEFASTDAEWSPNLPYDVYGEFALYISGLTREPIADRRSELKRAFDFINLLSEEGDDQVQNLVQVAILEILTDYRESVAAARALLSPRPLEWFEEMLSGWLKPQSE